MKPVDDELFAQIKERLAEHEEVYTPGAWERFEKREKKKTGWIWLGSLSTAAALVLIGFALFYTGSPIQNKDLQQQVKTSPSSPDIDIVPEITPDGRESNKAIDNLKKETTENKNIVEQRIRNNVPGNALIVKLNQPADSKPVFIPEVQPVTVPVQGTILNQEITTPVDKINKQTEDVVSEAIVTSVIKEKDSVKGNKPKSFQEFLDAEVRSNSAVAALKSTAKKAEKWELGLMVAPSMGNAKKLNMGYGLSMDYALSDKVSISSGISYNEVGATKEIGRNDGAMASPTSTPMVNETKSLKSVEANLVGIDIPIGIKYSLSKKFYTNIGISAFAVLNQKQNNNYVKGSVEYAMADDQPGYTGFKALFQTREVTEAVPSGEIRGDKYLGFYNFSFGFKQPISGSKAFSVEPFMKLPMKEFTKENLHLIGTGVKLKFDF